jgi:FAD/FMN-containing dehydrogenase
VLKNIRNPIYIGDQPAGTEVSGWLDAWTPAPSAYAVAARNAADVGAAVNFARENNLRLVVKGAGHSYLGTSNAPDSLLVWTRAMNKVTLHEAFVGQGCEGRNSPVSAVTAEAGAMWIDLYHAVTTEAGRYVQGGGCTTVGVAGLVQSGGFGSFSKGFGTAAAGLLEAEVVTADGKVRIANACTNPDLFWALKGGGGGSFGVITRLTLRTHELPEFFGFVGGKIKAQSDAAFRELITHFIEFYRDNLALVGCRLPKEHGQRRSDQRPSPRRSCKACLVVGRPWPGGGFPARVRITLVTGDALAERSATTPRRRAVRRNPPQKSRDAFQQRDRWSASGSGGRNQRHGHKPRRG